MFEVLCSGALRHCFMACDQSKNDPSGCYHVREPETKVFQMHFAEFRSCVQLWRQRKLCLKVREMVWHPAYKQHVTGTDPGPPIHVCADRVP